MKPSLGRPNFSMYKQTLCRSDIKTTSRQDVQSAQNWFTFSHNLTHGIWGKVNECTVQYSAVQYSTVQAYMPALALLRVKL